MNEFILNYTGALLVTGLLWSIVIVWKIKPRCQVCIAEARTNAALTCEVLEERRKSANLEADLKASRQEVKEMTERLLAHVGVKDLKPTEKLKGKLEEDAAERKRQEELVERGGASYGGGAD